MPVRNAISFCILRCCNLKKLRIRLANFRDFVKKLHSAKLGIVLIFWPAGMLFKEMMRVLALRHRVCSE